MSFRNTFITDFIYCASEDVIDSNKAVKAVFENHGIQLSNYMRDDGYGYYSGIIKTSELRCMLSEMELEELVWDLEKATKVPFRLTVMQESGAVITYPIEPRGKI